MPKNWIVTDTGAYINLDFLSKVVWAGSFASPGTPDPLSVILYHGGFTGTNSQQKLVYASEQEAKIAYRRILKVMQDQAIVTDLREIEPLALTSLDVVSGPAAGGTTVVLIGTGFRGLPSVAINGQPVSEFDMIDVDYIQFKTPPNAAGTYDLTYTDENNTVTTMAAAYTYV